MHAFNHRKYRPFPTIAMPVRHWPNRVIQQAPRWCAVDLRDGNQALIEPMSVAEKSRLFDLLLKVGFREIEVGFPAASQPDYDFVRSLIEQQRVPEGVSIQVLTQARPDLIARSFEALRGAKRAVVHLYNSTSPVQREQVFGLDRAGIIDLAVRGATAIQAHAAQYPDTQWQFEYSPESFTGTELDFALEICEAVLAVWQPTPAQPVIINLPSTVEMATPNVYADQIEWFCSHLSCREAVIISVHTHNDRGCAVAAAELAVMAGADRVEGTLLGNGERTGNMDIVTMAMNLYSQGIDPQLNLSGLDEIVKTVESCTHLAVHPRHPYAGELVYSAFSGSHQDAIRKCLASYQPGTAWQVAYLPIDPADVGRSYQAVIRINSQSGKGGVASVLARDYGLNLPRWLQIEFSPVVQQAAEAQASEISPAQLWDLFAAQYLANPGPYQMLSYQLKREQQFEQVAAQLRGPAGTLTLHGSGQGALEAWVTGLQQQFGIALEVTGYSEHAMTTGTQAKAAAYVQIRCAGASYSGVDLHQDTVSAAVNAVLKAVNRYLLAQTVQPLAA